MQEEEDSLDTSLAGLDVQDWLAGLAEMADAEGMFEELGDHHFATFIERDNTLLVTFETVHGIRNLSSRAQPLGFDMVRAQDWSHLCLVSDGDTWFRDPVLYEFFDRLIDDGFFESYHRIVFYGAGPCGYAAAAFSVSAPGATVLAVQPQATLDPRMTEWDPRFPEMRRTSFTDRYGYAPDMVDAADSAFVFYDPRETLDAMHAALFRRPNVTRLRMTHMGDALQTRLVEMGLLYQVLLLAGTGRLTEAAFARLYRARREHPPYLRNLMTRLDAEDRPYLNALLCRSVTERMNAPRLYRRLNALKAAADTGSFRFPPQRKAS
ncbi:phosphoadenosine phosphosulfate reductase [Marinibacterium profundimaris]|uniref:Phosphoadenosine phosphosulfate reductase n=1 Tax=Marinibacterium profundimaris TaxID=1679460 RepID=A0A225P0W3_9RHOB|nr:phosphoadenosine phosphosulfate reductase [Marinibacterium profundimaris]OWU77856.1 phosphoadenosine phosphosulfate reductase [Marinibacterium profundimaris]